MQQRERCHGRSAYDATSLKEQSRSTMPCPLDYIPLLATPLVCAQEIETARCGVSAEMCLKTAQAKLSQAAPHQYLPPQQLCQTKLLITGTKHFFQVEMLQQMTANFTTTALFLAPPSRARMSSEEAKKGSVGMSLLMQKTQGIGGQEPSERVRSMRSVMLRCCLATR